MRIFVSGATGFIGIQLVKRLSEAGHHVHALYRSESKKKLIDFPGVVPFLGDIQDAGSVRRALKGCEQAYHVAAFAAVWTPDPGLIHRLNVDASLQLLDIASELGVRRVVVTSTAGILGPSDARPGSSEDKPNPSGDRMGSSMDKQESSGSLMGSSMDKQESPGSLMGSSMDKQESSDGRIGSSRGKLESSGRSQILQAVDENSPVPDSFFTEYEASKQALEDALKRREAVARKGKAQEAVAGEVADAARPEVVLVNPTRVYGPGYLSTSNGVTRMLLKYLQGKWRFIPGSGRQSGNYVHVEDVVSGHILAMERGRPGERYLLGGEDLSYLDLFELCRQVSGAEGDENAGGAHEPDSFEETEGANKADSHGTLYRAGKKLYHMPLWLMLTASHIMLGLARLTGRPPLIVPGLVRKFNHHWKVSSQKAIRELGYAPRSAREGIRDTVEWIRSLS